MVWWAEATLSATGGNFLAAELPGIATLLDQVHSNEAHRGKPYYTAEKRAAAQKVRTIQLQDHTIYPHFVAANLCHIIVANLRHFVNANPCYFVDANLCHFVDANLCHFINMILC